MTDASNTDSRRQFSRVPFRVEARLLLSDGVHPVKVKDLALKGALVESDTALVLQRGDAARLVMVLDDDGDQIELNGIVVHTEGKRIGLQSQDIDVDSLTNLRRLIELNLGDASMVDRELSQLFGNKTPE